MSEMESSTTVPAMELKTPSSSLGSTRTGSSYTSTSGTTFGTHGLHSANESCAICEEERNRILKPTESEFDRKYLKSETLESPYSSRYSTRESGRYETLPRESWRESSRYETLPRESWKESSRYETLPRESWRESSRYETLPRESWRESRYESFPSESWSRYEPREWDSSYRGTFREPSYRFEEPRSELFFDPKYPRREVGPMPIYTSSYPRESVYYREPEYLSSRYESYPRESYSSRYFSEPSYGRESFYAPRSGGMTGSGMGMMGEGIPKLWLVCVDNSVHSDYAVQQTMRIMDRSCDQIVLLNIQKIRGFGGEDEVRAAESRRVGEEVLRKYMPTLENAGIKYSAYTRSSRVVTDEIISQAEIVRPNFIVLGCRPKTKFRSLFTSSISDTIAKRASCPVLIAREKSHTVA